MLRNYIQSVKTNFDRQFGHDLGSYFTIDIQKHIGGEKLILEYVNNPNLNILVQENVKQLLRLHLTVMSDLRDKRLESACNNQNEFLVLLESVVENEGGWIIDLVIQSCRETRQLCAHYDKTQASKGNIQMMNSSQKLRNMFRTCNKERSDVTSTRLACIPIMNEFFKSCFHLNNFQQCTSQIQVIEQKGYLNDVSLKKSYLCCYCYYAGRLSLYEEKYDIANRLLTQSLSLCHSKHRRNVKRIMKYLIPVRISCGILPSQQLLTQYHFTMYEMLCESLRRGDIPLFQSVIEDYQEELLRSGLYICIISLETLVYGSFIKHVIDSLPPSTTQLKFEHLHFALSKLGLDKSDEELFCVLSNLIQRKLLKGYIAYSQRTVVYSKVKSVTKLKLHSA